MRDINSIDSIDRKYGYEIQRKITDSDRPY